MDHDRVQKNKIDNYYISYLNGTETVYVGKGDGKKGFKNFILNLFGKGEKETLITLREKEEMEYSKMYSLKPKLQTQEYSETNICENDQSLEK